VIAPSELPLVSPRADERELLASRLEAIAVDLRRLNDPTSVMPTPAIAISDWCLSATPVLTISGFAEDHPKLGSEVIATSQVYYINIEDRLVRTLSRWYRLGVPLQGAQSSSEH
jgi:hypothetical protein